MALSPVSLREIEQPAEHFNLQHQSPVRQSLPTADSKFSIRIKYDLGAPSPCWSAACTFNAQDSLAYR
ncbi:hypothetical protein Q31a_01900 [Aureliella helgolandensis]|uniref:Uncharacterized protein n=1 Tax=Aureliella helgolandensis TaxID=2527968 RepID=A0A518FZZ6_9BACT|nr:hypothetical protein Q31a_01900 [Aureliella helgolandensis]